MWTESNSINVRIDLNPASLLIFKERKFNNELINCQETITLCMKSQLEANLQDTCLFTSVVLNGTLFGNKRSTI